MKNMVRLSVFVGLCRIDGFRGRKEQVDEGSMSSSVTIQTFDDVDVVAVKFDIHLFDSRYKSELISSFQSACKCYAIQLIQKSRSVFPFFTNCSSSSLNWALGCHLRGEKDTASYRKFGVQINCKKESSHLDVRFGYFKIVTTLLSLRSRI